MLNEAEVCSVLACDDWSLTCGLEGLSSLFWDCLEGLSSFGVFTYAQKTMTQQVESTSGYETAHVCKHTTIKFSSELENSTTHDNHHHART